MIDIILHLILVNLLKFAFSHLPHAHLSQYSTLAPWRYRRKHLSQVSQSLLATKRGWFHLSSDHLSRWSALAPRQYRMEHHSQVFKSLLATQRDWVHLLPSHSSRCSTLTPQRYRREHLFQVFQSLLTTQRGQLSHQGKTWRSRQSHSWPRPYQILGHLVLQPKIRSLPDSVERNR